MQRFALLAVTVLSLAGCDTIDDWFAKEQKIEAVGERISVIAFDSQLDPDPQLADTPVALPKPWRNPEWPQAGGYPSHAMQHLELPDRLRTAWTADLGAEADDEQKILAQPVIAGGRVFAMDAAAQVSAFDAASGRRLWRVNLTPRREETGATGGGLAWHADKLFVATGYGDVIALEPSTGRAFWATQLKQPIRGAPTAEGGRVFVVTYDNQLHALDTERGTELWLHTGVAEQAGFLGAANPASEGNTVVVPYSSGEILALRADTGVVAWGEQLVRSSGRISQAGALNDINGRPVIDRGRVYAVSQSGRFIAIDLRTGERVWERVIASIQTPWVAGDFIYAITIDAEIICLSRRDGKVKWIRQLRRYLDPKAKTNKGVITWWGPVLAGDRLLVASTDERMLSISPYTGDLIGQIELSDKAAQPPVVADGTVYIVTEDARLTALR
ncbi:MAG: PQQ-like beta-propeller repeat protein [Ferrovibrio sp.]|uniref:PQQ-like beta-propeller repeat protein n=1 Tax=Ferrovibrio sp. TaxID=1917215 RepID=UPI00260E5F39|nr:PQQ-like beta-propeller repeat protein [Ferrovibrio sp.]MCW0233790.1 PQQ-like beta-propeller repeat protein [Ferrovibrio sp.]